MARGKGLADGIASLATAYAVTTALHARATSGTGQVIDLAIIEPILALLGPQITRWAALGTTAPRTGNRSSNNAPRNTYRTRDGGWVAVSTSAQSIAERVMALVGRPDFIGEPWFASGSGRAAHGEELDEAVSVWIAARDRDDVVAQFEAAQAAVAPIYDAADIAADPQYEALGTIITMPDPDLGEVAMQGPLFRLSDGVPPVRFTGRAPGANTDEVLAELGFSPEEIVLMHQEGSI